MILVAFVAVVIAAGRKSVKIRRRHHVYLAAARDFGSYESMFRRAVARQPEWIGQLIADAEWIRKGRLPESFRTATDEHGNPAFGGVPTRTDLLRLAESVEGTIRFERKRLALYQKHAEFYTCMRRKYEQAARRPWAKVSLGPTFDQNIPGSRNVYPVEPNLE